MSTDKITIDVSDFTLGEIEEFEEIAGVPMSSLSSQNTPARAMTALVLIAKRRTDPDFTIEQARLIRMGELEVVDGEADPTPSTDGADEAG